VNTQEAKVILMAYRPWAADAGDPDFAEALTLVPQDAELRRWFEEHCAGQRAIRDRFRQRAAPAGLKEQILAGHPGRSKVIWLRQPVSPWMAAAAVVVVAIGIAVFWMRPPAVPVENVNTATFRSRMEGWLLRNYTMTLETNNLEGIRADLARQEAPADFVLSGKLSETPLAGCGVLRWQDKRVSMICFLTGKPLPTGGKSDLFLFVVDRSSLPDAPATSSPQINPGTKLITATWTIGDKTYVLATEGDADFIRRYL
jgi:hypothetical protein